MDRHLNWAECDRDFDLRAEQIELCDRKNFIIFDAGCFEADRFSLLQKLNRTIGAKRPDSADCSAGINSEMHVQRTHGIEATNITAGHVWISVVQHVKRVAALSFPREELEHSLAGDG